MEPFNVAIELASLYYDLIHYHLQSQIVFTDCSKIKLNSKMMNLKEGKGKIFSF